MRRAALSLALLLVAAAAVAVEPSLQVEVDPPRLGVEDTARLVIRVQEPGRGRPQPKLGEMVNLVAVAGPSVGTEFSFVNGVATNSMTFTYVLQPQAVGPAKVGSIEVEIDDKVLRSEPISVEVVGGSLAPPRRQQRVPGWPFVDSPMDSMQPPASQRQASIELRQMAAKSAIYQGEAVAVTVVLDSTVASIEAFEWQSAPTFPGWWTQRVDIPDQVTPELVEVDGTRFQRYVIARYVLVPLKTGTLELPELSARIGVRARSLFARQQVVERSAAARTVTVRALPDAPEGYSGAVGQLRYSARLEPEAVEIGQSAVLTVELEGSGNLPLVEAPGQWPSCSSCDNYPPEEDEDVKVDSTGIHGRRTWRMTFVPREVGALRLEPVILAVFDPGAGHYRRFPLGPMTLDVAPPPPTPTPSPVPGAEPAAEIAPSEEVSPPLVTATTPGNQWRWWLALLVAALGGGMLGALLVTRRGRRVIPPRRAGQSPADRARELQVVLESWWFAARERASAEQLRPEMDELRRQLEAVRFAPGRADHSDTITDLEDRLRALVRK